jgi:hypothetical protein
MDAAGINLDSVPESQLLNESQTAEALNIKASTLSVWRCTGRVSIPYVKIGRSVRYRAGDIRAFLESRKRHHTGQE